MNSFIAKTHANIALIKYWGKRNNDLVLPTKNSLSVSLESLQTSTKVSLNDSDKLVINNVNVVGESLTKFIYFLNKFRLRFEVNKHFMVESFNNFPTSAGLASSASGFAAMTLALDGLCKLNLDKKELSILARLGSGSACRSLYDGFTVWHRGSKDDGSDSFAEQIFETSHWPEFRIIVVIVDSEKKKISSSEGMQITSTTAKNYGDWIVRSEKRFNYMIEAIRQRDFAAVGTMAEHDCLEMHETMRNSSPLINYFNEKTTAIIDLVRALRTSGIKCYFTIDAGPNVKIITNELHQNHVLDKLKTISGIQKIIISKVA